MPRGSFARDMSGEKHGRLMVLRRHEKKRGDLVLWECLCECGGKKITAGKFLKNGASKSCGCLHIEASCANLPDTTLPIGSRREHNGYIEIRLESGFRREHTHIMETNIGRHLKHGEVVHHKDLDKHNNDIDNLQLMSNGEHTTLHNLLRGKR